MITEQKLEHIENQIKDQKQSIGYDVKDYTIEYLVDKFQKGEETDQNEIYVPDYQREFIWEESRQSKFVESIFLGLPVPMVFLAEVEDRDNRYEIIDGSQRIRTLAAYLNNHLEICYLTKLSELNGTTFNELKPSQQRSFRNTVMRTIILSSRADETVRNDMFGRINTTSVPLTGMENRRGVHQGDFMDFIKELAESKKFKSLCPMDKHFENRREEEELVLRFFAFAESYPKFTIFGSDLERTGVARLLDKYLQEKNKTFSSTERSEKQAHFFEMLDFIEKIFGKRGFRKNSNSQATSRVYFEALSVGSHLALKSGKVLKTTNLDWAILDNKNPNEFNRVLSSKYHTHKPNKIRERISYVLRNFTE